MIVLIMLIFAGRAFEGHLVGVHAEPVPTMEICHQMGQAREQEAYIANMGKEVPTTPVYACVERPELGQ